jgi:hypothetical protein
MNRTEESFPSSRKSKKEKLVEGSIFSSPSPSSDYTEESTNASTDSSTNVSFFGNNNFVIILLVILLVFPAIGMMIMSFLGNTYKEITEKTNPVISNFLKLFGYSAGTVINTSADVAGDVAKVGVDILEGSVHNVGNLVQGKTGDYPTDKTFFNNNNNSNNMDPKTLDSTIEKKVDTAISKKLGNTVANSNRYKNPADVSPDHSSGTIQNPISSGKAGWCLTGEYQNKRGCLSVSESDQCLSGQIFPSKEMCLNPTLTP